MQREFSVVIERDEEGYFVASVPAIPGCHTQARSLDDLMDRVREAISACLDDDAGSGADLEFIGVQCLRDSIESLAKRSCNIAKSRCNLP